MKKALILGITSQDGLLLSKYLLAHGYSIVGTTRGLNTRTTTLLTNLNLIRFVDIVKIDLTNVTQVRELLNTTKFDEVYNLAAQSSVARSFKDPVSTFNSIIISASVLLQTLVELDYQPRIFNACSSECFGSTTINKPFDESSSFSPISPYALAKYSAFLLFKHYRTNYNMYISNGILFNHESPFRASHFVSQKIVSAAKNIYEGNADYIELGNLDVIRDWGWSPEYVIATYMLLQHADPVDVIISTGKSSSLYSFASAIFSCFSLNLDSHLKTNPSFMRSADLVSSFSSPKLIYDLLGWKATSLVPDISKKLVYASLYPETLSDPFSL